MGGIGQHFGVELYRFGVVGGRKIGNRNSLQGTRNSRTNSWKKKCPKKKNGRTGGQRRSPGSGGRKWVPILICMSRVVDGSKMTGKGKKGKNFF